MVRLSISLDGDCGHCEAVQGDPRGRQVTDPQVKSSPHREFHLQEPGNLTLWRTWIRMRSWIVAEGNGRLIGFKVFLEATLRLRGVAKTQFASPRNRLCLPCFENPSHHCLVPGNPYRRPACRGREAGLPPTVAAADPGSGNVGRDRGGGVAGGEMKREAQRATWETIVRVSGGKTTGRDSTIGIPPMLRENRCPKLHRGKARWRGGGRQQRTWRHDRRGEPEGRGNVDARTGQEGR